VPDSPPAQQQSPPGDTGSMEPDPRDEMRGYRGRDLLDGTVALVTGGSGLVGGALIRSLTAEGVRVLATARSRAGAAAGCD